MSINVVSLCKRKPVTMYFIFSCIFTWLILAPGVAAYAGIIEFGIDGTVLTIMGGFGPLLSAILVTALISGRRGVRALLAGMFKWKVNWKWWVVSICMFAGFFLLAALLLKLTGQEFPSAQSGVYLNGGNIILVVFLLLAGSLGEEPGWRGFALPRLQTYGNPFKMAFVLTFIWWVWHLPTYWVLPMAIQSVETFGFIGAYAMQFLVLFALNLLCTWVTNGSKGSLLMPILLHASWNFWVGAFGQQVSGLLLLCLIISAMVVGIGTKWKFSYHIGQKQRRS